MNLFKRSVIPLVIFALIIFSCTTEKRSSKNPPPEPENIDVKADQVNLYSTPEIFGWIILDRNMEKVIEYINTAPDFGINAIQLSHDIIMDIDEIFEVTGTADFINQATDSAHEKNIKVYIWTHELNNAPSAVCFDPADPFWEDRKNVYRAALSLVPDVDGVVLSFGSAETEIWWAPCFCQYCLNLPPTGNPLLDLIHSHPAERINLILDILHQVIVNEFGKELVVRTFIHHPEELDWMSEALHTCPVRELTVMSKDVVHDWEPYYPHDPTICDNGGFDEVIEFDLAGEYWGASTFPFTLPDYLKYRLDHDLKCKAKGAFGRVELGPYAAMDTPNEINLFAFSKLLNDITKPTDEIWSEWVQKKYEVDTESTEGQALISALRRTFDVGKKMYYVKGFWLEKGSELPIELDGIFEMLKERSLALWDPDYKPWDQELKNPTKQTLSDIAQEKYEAIELANKSLSELETAKAALKDEDYQDLKHRLEHLRDCTLIWDHVYQAAFRYKLYKNTGDQTEKLYLEWNLDSLSGLADYMESAYGAGILPGNPGRIRALVKDIRSKFGDFGDGVPFEQMKIENIEVCELGATYAQICWETTEPASSIVGYGFEIPDYGYYAGNPTELITSHRVKLNGLRQKTRHVFFVQSQTSNGTVITSGDYSFTTR